MPTTINGIGTHYWGKRNRSSRTGVCRNCGRTATLTSYDTRLWCVVFFVPVIPLGRKRILDECSVCRRHYQADLAKFAVSQQLTTSGARDQYRNDRSRDGALAAHLQLLEAHAVEDAASFREQAVQDFPHDALLHARLALQLEAAGDHSMAAPLYARAYELDPDLPEARLGESRARLANGQLDEARRMLDFLEQPGAGQLYPLERLEQLAQAYQKAGRHAETLELCRELIRELPALGEHREFRKFVQKSEKQVRGETMLPSQRFSLRELFSAHSGRYSQGQRWAAYLTLAAVLAVVGLAGVNEYRRRHRTVLVYNEFGPRAKVVIDGLEAPRDKHSEVSLAEGVHHISITGAVNDEFDLQLSTGSWERLVNSPVWIINVGGATALAEQTLHYAVHPQPSETAISLGTRVYAARHIDYLFEDGPDHLDVGSESGEVIKHQLSVLDEKASDLFSYALSNAPREQALMFAESRLVLDPADDELLDAYVRAIADEGKDRAAAFFAKHLDDRPVLVEWHRMYEHLSDNAAEKQALVKKYDQWLAQEPRSAELLYLRGRLATSGSESKVFYDRALAADENFGRPWGALGYLAASRGDWPTARRCYEQAAKLGMKDAVGPLAVARIAQGEAKEVDREMQEAMASLSPAEALPIVLNQVAARLVQEDAAGAHQAVDDWLAKVAASGETAPQELQDGLHANVDFAAGDYAAAERRTPSPSPVFLFNLWLVTDRAQQAAEDERLAALRGDPHSALALSVALAREGKSDLADKWRTSAAEGLAQRGFDEQRAAGLLNRDEPPTKAELDEAVLSPDQKSVLLIALAQKHEPSRAELLEMARQLAVEPGGSTQLVQQVAAEGAQP